MPHQDLADLRTELAHRSKWNVGYFWSGFLFWVFVAAVGSVLPLSQARVYWLIGTFLIFPVAVAVSKLVGADPFGKGNALGELVGYTHMSVISLTFPLVLAAFVYLPEALPLVMAIAYCVDFYVMSWAFGHPVFGIHAAVRVVAVTIIWFAMPGWRMTVLPAVVAFAYLVTALALPFLRSRWLEQRSSAPSA
jgi:hypothetical protein